ncbi:MAG: hypothetical protein Q7S79_02140 [bacterium]|nr:hypothetical protein [bacterium]
MALFSPARKVGTRTSINLVPQDLKETPKRRTARRVLSRTSSVLLGAYMFALVLLFGFSFFLSSRVKGLEGTNTKLVSDVTALSEKEILLHTIKNRTDLARKIYSNTTPQSAELFDRVVELVPGDVSIIGAETKEGAVTLSAVSKNPSAIQNFLVSLENAKLRDVAVQTLTSAYGQYMVTVHVQ